MKYKKSELRFFILGLIASFFLQGCDKDNEQEKTPELPPENSISVKQVDMKVVIPIHPSSLDYFDYVVCYSDNTGEEYRDTISQNVSTQALDEDIYYIKNFVYKSIPVVCRCEVNLLPKVSRDSVVSFSYTIPKPYIFSRAIFDSHSYTPQMGNSEIEGVEILKLDSITIGNFLSVYGAWFCSFCRVEGDYDGVSVSFL